MRNFKKLLIATATTAVMITAVQAKQSEGIKISPKVDGGFTKLATKARFIDGENLIERTPQLTEADLYVQPKTLQERADALETVMVTRDGSQYVKKVDPKDLAIFEKAVKDLEKLGLNSSVFTSVGRLPTNFDKLDPIQRTLQDGDDRVRITNTMQNPYWYIGRTSLGCTGTLVGPKHVLTAGHCISDGKGGWYSALDFSVAQNGNSKPWGTESWARALTVSEWHNYGDSRYDYGMIVLKDSPHGGYTTYGQYSSGTHTVTGYPGEKAYGTMWTDSGATSSDNHKIYYTLDTSGGQSGSGVRDSSNVVRGIHAYGYGSYNGGTRIQSTVFNQIQNWINNN